MAATMTKSETKTLIKKQRKRLKEIETLERHHRALTPDERVKVRSKRKVRKFLQSLLAEYISDNVVTGESEELDHDRQEIDSHIQGNDFGDHLRDIKKEEVRVPQKQNTDNIGRAERRSEEIEIQKQQPKDAGSNVTKVKPTQPAPTGDVAKGHGKNESKQPSKDVGKYEQKQPPKDKDQTKVDKGTSVISKVSAKVPSSDGTEKETKKKKPPRPSLSTKQFKVTNLEGHSDLITAVVLHGETLVTASRDTTVKTWDVVTGAQLKNFGGHTNSVTCLLVLDVTDAQKSVPDLMETKEPLVISGSYDCSLKVWSLNSGHLLKSIYTYNPVSQIAYTSDFSLLILGSDTGKLELWDLDSGQQQYSVHAYDASVTGIKIADKQLYTSASDGTIKIYSVTNDNQLSCVFVSENVRSSSGGLLTARHVRSLELCQKGTLIGDDARNIKILNWKKNEASKVPNHNSDYSSTDAIRCHGDFIVSSSYDLDSGLGYINVRSSQSMEYQATFDDKDTERILCLDTNTLPGGNMVIVTGGLELKVWEVLKQRSEANEDDVFHAEFRQSLSEAAIDSEDEDDDDDDDDDEDDSFNESASGSGTKSLGFQQDAETWSWTSWCTVI